jgi:hypothetical protein
MQIAYRTLQGATPSIDPEFVVEVAWNTSVLEGYPWVHLPNRSPFPGIGRFFGLFNPGVWGLIRKSHFDAAILPDYFYFSAWIAITAAKWSGTPILFLTESHSLRSWNAQSPWKLWPAFFVKSCRIPKGEREWERRRGGAWKRGRHGSARIEFYVQSNR